MSGGEAALAAAVLAGSYMQYEAADDAASETRKAQAAAAADAARNSEEMGRKIIAFGQENLTPEVREKELAQNDDRLRNEMAALAMTMPNLDPSNAGNVSQDYITALAERSASAKERVADKIRRTAKVQAPGAVDFTQGLRAMQLDRDVQGMNSANRTLMNAHGEKIAGIRPDAFQQFLGQALGTGAIVAAGRSGSSAGAGKP